MATKNKRPTSEAGTAQPTPQADPPPEAQHRIALIARLTADPQLRYTGNGNAVTRMRVANDGIYDTRYYTVVAWRRLGEIAAQYLTKGQRVCVTGRLQDRSWTGARWHRPPRAADRRQRDQIPLAQALDEGRRLTAALPAGGRWDGVVAPPNRRPTRPPVAGRGIGR